MTSHNSLPLEPVQLSRNSRFCFECRKDLSCFTECCRGTTIALTPYDIIRLRKRLSLSSDDFLALYTYPELLEKTDIPVPVLKLLDEETSPCPFVREEGCLVYEDRPAACRYYPLGHATMRPKESDSDEEFFFFVREAHCTGYEQEKEWSVDDWLTDQGADAYDKANAGWSRLIVRKRSFPPNIRITEQAKKMFFMAFYNPDKFRQFVLESSFLSLYPVKENRLETVKEDDQELLALATDWMEGILFGRGPLVLDREAAEKRLVDRDKNPGQ